MSVLLKNRSIYPNSMMQLFAELAYKLSGCRGDVVVKVGNGSKKGYSGLFRHTSTHIYRGIIYPKIYSF